MSERLANIVQKFITIQIQIKTFHWQTFNYSNHKVADKLYEKFLELSDTFVETFMGQQGKHLTFQTNKHVTLCNISQKKMITILKTFAKFLTSLTLTSDLQNIRDEILGLVHKNLYLLSLK